MKKLTKIAFALIAALAISACSNEAEESSDPFAPLLSQSEIDELTIDAKYSDFTDGNWIYQNRYKNTNYADINFEFSEEMLSGLSAKQIAEVESWIISTPNIMEIPFDSYESISNTEFSKKGDNIKVTKYESIRTIKSNNSLVKKVLKNIGFSWEDDIGTNNYEPTEEDYNTWIVRNIYNLNLSGMKTNSEHNKFYKEYPLETQFLVKQ